MQLCGTWNNTELEKSETKKKKKKSRIETNSLSILISLVCDELCLFEFEKKKSMLFSLMG